MSHINIHSSRGTINLRPVMGRKGPTGPGADVTGAQIEAARDEAVAAAASVPQLVTDTLADDDTVALAAAAAAADAVDGELATRDLIEGDDPRVPRVVPQEEYLWVVVDAENRIGLAVTVDGTVVGKFELDAGSVPAAALGPDVPLPITFATGADYSFVLVDAAGRVGELAMDAAGKVPQYILDRWAARMALPVPTETLSIELPSKVYVVTGTEQQWIHGHYVKALSADHRVKALSVVGGSGSYNDRWKVTPTIAGTGSLTVTVSDRAAEQVATKTVSVVVNDTTLTTPCRLLPIGDSITRTGAFASTAATILGGTTVGTREVDGVLNDGRGGWKMADYAADIGNTADVDSPFLFPTGVAAERFVGNTEAWRQIVDPVAGLEYAFSGFQRIARPGFASSGAFLYDSTGYPVTPVSGDVVIDPTRSAGDKWRTYNGSAWVALADQTVEVNFSKYMTRYAAAFSGGDPTAISIMLGTNDFYAGIDDAAFATFAARLDTLITSIRVWSGTVPIAVCIPPVGGHQDDWATAQTHKFEYEDRMFAFSELMRAQYDTDAARTNKVFLTSFLGCVDDEDFTPSGTVHPGEGHTTMGAVLAGTLAHALN